tara:strand:+ start:619 stop:747 length:129 start_codon:yes stop_codon:yes gene_type:complete
MPIPLRKFYAQKLIEAKQKESKSYEDAKNQQSNPNQITPKSH